MERAEDKKYITSKITSIQFPQVQKKKKSKDRAEECDTGIRAIKRYRSRYPKTTKQKQVLTGKTSLAQ